MAETEAVWIKEETNEIHSEPDSVTEEDPLEIEELSLHVKEEPELKICGSGHNMVVSTTQDSGCRRLIKNNAECCSISLEESVNQRAVKNEFNEDAEESTHSAMFCTCTKGLPLEQQMSMGDTALPATRNEKFHGSDYQENTRFFEGQLENSFVEQTERQSSTQEICLASKKFFNIILKTQITSHNSVESDRCNNCFTLPFTSVSAPPVSIATEKYYKCDVCGKSFTKKNSVRQHVLTHIGIKPHKCGICDKSFTLLSHLKNHALIHSGMKHHKCDSCGKSFTRLDGLNRHTLIHSGIKPHKCNTCGKCFTWLGALKEHVLIHSGIKAYKCDTCGKCFAQLGTLRKHTLIHFGVKRHRCDTCGKSFTQLGGLKKHLLIHSGIKTHKCDTCGKCFTWVGALKNHAVIHCGIKRHKCNTCGKPFSRLHDLKKHALIHSGIKPHKCDTCGISFTALSNLKRHALTHTKIKP